jgi:phosphoribosylglycinamide formyltransferase-1
MTLGVLISGNGSNLQALIDAINSKHIPAQIGVVISNKRGAYGLTRAKQNNIPSNVILRNDFRTQGDYDDAMINTLLEYRVDLVILAGFLSILSARVVNAFKGRIINVHPSLIPSFCGKGYYGKKVHKAVLDYGVKLSGATVHFVDEGTDTGPIIFQEAVAVEDTDTIDSLSLKVLAAEHRLLIEAVKMLVQGRLLTDGRKVNILVP